MYLQYNILNMSQIHDNATPNITVKGKWAYSNISCGKW